MRLLEIQDGISINTNKIEGIEKIDETSCKVYCGSITYVCKMAYSTLLDVLKNEEVVNRKQADNGLTEETLKKVNAVLERSEFFAG